MMVNRRFLNGITNGATMKVLMVITSHDQLGDNGRKTGLLA
jgi:hypothetical protein